MNLFNIPGIPTPPAEELVTILAQSPHTKIERIVSCGHTTDWYDQDQAEFVTILQGEGELTYADGSTQRLKTGDTAIIPPHKKHRVSYTSTTPPCIWLCVFYPV